MHCVAIIAEFNPFHTGHVWLLKQLRQHFGPEAVLLIIMSGSFVQRGEPALFDKWQRATWAVQNGADCVIELPAVFVLSSATGFARGGVELAVRLGCTHLACGVESGTADDFQALAREALNIDPIHSERTFGQNVSEALASTVPSAASLLQSPNNLLAFEYVKALLAKGRPLNFYPVLRQHSHNDITLGGSFASASALRHCLSAGQPDNLTETYLPNQERMDIKTLLSQGRYTDYNRYGECILLQNRLLTLPQLRNEPAFNEGLEHRWQRCFRQAVTYTDALAAVKTRRYAYSRLCRMGAYTLLRPGRELFNQSYEQGPQYARLLAFTEHGTRFLKRAKAQFPVITKITSQQAGLTDLGRSQLSFDIRCTDLQYFCFYGEQERKAGADYYTSPLYLSSADKE